MLPSPKQYEPRWMSCVCSRCNATANGEMVYSSAEHKALHEKWKRQGWTVNRRVRGGANLLCPQCSSDDLPDYVI